MVEAKQKQHGEYDLALKLEQRKADKVFSKEEVAKHTAEDDAWVIVDGIVYDITDLIHEHPGGIDIVAGKLGKDVTETMKNPKIHQHSKAAYTMLDLYRIGRLESTAKPAYDERPLGWGPIDFTKPVLHQVGCMGKAYNDWVQSDPIHFKEPVTLFGHPALEYFTHVKWWNVPLHWVPITLIGLVYSFNTASYGVIPFTLLLALGFIIWVLLEYNLHKYLFHNVFLATKGWYVTNVVHFITHGFHHKVPMDKDRLVAPFSFALIVGGPIIGTILYLFPLPVALNILSGLYIGYMFYDLTHYSLHHASNPKLLPFPFNWIFSTKTFQALRTHHVIHHFAPNGHDNNFGISNQTIDIVMNSLQREHYKRE